MGWWGPRCLRMDCRRVLEGGRCLRMGLRGGEEVRLEVARGRKLGVDRPLTRHCVENVMCLKAMDIGWRTPVCYPLLVPNFHLNMLKPRSLDRRNLTSDHSGFASGSGNACDNEYNVIMTALYILPSVIPRRQIGSRQAEAHTHPSACLVSNKITRESTRFGSERRMETNPSHGV